MMSSDLSKWRVVAGACVAISLSLTVYLSYLFGLFLKPLAAEFGWTRGEMSLGGTISLYTVMFASPFLGNLADRLGARRLLLPSIAAFAIVVSGAALLSSDIRLFYALHMLLALSALGTLPLTYTRAVVGWFDSRRGLALGLTLGGVGLGGAIYPLILADVIADYGWRTGYVVIGLLLASISLPAAFLWVVESSSSSNVAKVVSGLTFVQARRTRTFRTLAAALGLMGVVTTGFSIHLPSLLTDRGLSNGIAAAGVSTLGLSLVAGRVAAGWLLDTFSAHWVAAVVLGLSVTGLVIASTGASGYLLFLAIILVGIGIGAEFDFLSFFIARDLGLQAYGRIYGWIYAVFMFGCGIGPILMGFGFDRAGNYELALATLAACTAVAALLFLRLAPLSAHDGGKVPHAGR